MAELADRATLIRLLSASNDHALKAFALQLLLRIERLEEGLRNHPEAAERQDDRGGDEEA